MKGFGMPQSAKTQFPALVLQIEEAQVFHSTLTFMSVILNPGCLVLLPEELSLYNAQTPQSNQLN